MSLTPRSAIVAELEPGMVVSFDAESHGHIERYNVVRVDASSVSRRMAMSLDGDHGQRHLSIDRDEPVTIWTAD